MSETYVILENVRSAQNVGAIFRTSEAIGIARIFLVGYTPTPIDRFGRIVPDITKTALGAEAMVPWEHSLTIGELLTRLQKDGVKIVSVEKTDGARDYKQCVLSERTALVFGNEVDGVSPEALSASDEVILLPMRGMKESLNVATTVGIVLYRLLDI